MSRTLTPEIIERSLTVTLEDAAFVFVESSPPQALPGESEAPELSAGDIAAPDLIAADLSIRGPQSCTLSLVVPRGFGVLLAANLMGIEPDSPDADQAALDAVGEILNMTSGTLAEHWLGNGASYELGTPVVTAGADVQPAALQSRASFTVHLLAEDAYPIQAMASFSPETSA
jgi:hypothetical protein